MKTLALVTSVGARTAMGPSATQTGFLLRTGVPAITASPLVVGEGEPVVMGFDATLDPYQVGEERAAALGEGALRDALEPLREVVENLSLLMVLCVDEPGGGVAEGHISDRLVRVGRRWAPRMDIDVCARGAAGAAFALPAALAALSAGRVDGVLLGGVHTDYDPGVLGWLWKEGRLFTPENVDAVMPGEAAAFALLLREDTASRLKLGGLSRVCGVGSAMAREGEGGFEAHALCAAVRGAAGGLVEDQVRAGWTLTDHAFEVYRLQEWQTMMVRTQALWGSPYLVESPAQRMGRLGAAAMPLAMVLATEGWAGGYGASGIAVAIAGSDAGERGAILMSA